MSGIKSIRTEYNGYCFRSRLEARWAVFFDYLRVPYWYEPAVILLDKGPYLPDFFLPTIRGGCWIEIKGETPSWAAESKVDALSALTGQDAFIFHGDIPHLKTLRDGSVEFLHDEGSAYAAACNDIDHRWCICPKCGRLGIEYYGRGARVCGNECCPGEDKSYSDNHPRLLAAYDAARAAQFTPAETGRA